FSLKHVARRAAGAAEIKLPATRGVAGHFDGLVLDAADVSDDLPDFFLGHADALLGGPVGRHGSTRNAIADGGENFLIGVAVLFWSARQVGATAAASRAESMAKRAVRAEFILAELGHPGIAGEWILGLSSRGLRNE